MGNPQKAKGSSWERDVAKFLSNLYDETFIRAPGSGAYIGGTNVHRKANLDESKIRTFKGDVIPGESYPLLNIECKNYKDIGWHLLYSGDCKQLEDWIDQLLASADTNDINLLAMKFTRKGTFIAFQASQTELSPGKNYTTYSSIKKPHYGTWFILDFNTFWDINKNKITDLNQAATKA